MPVNYAQDWLEVEKLLGMRPLFSGSVDEIRQQFAVVAQNPQKPDYGPAPSSVESFEYSTSSPTNPKVTLRVYKPKGVEGPLPIGFYTHGGGLVLGNLESDDYMLRCVSQAVPAVIVQVDYRLAPETKFHGIFEDVYAGFQWTLENAEKLGGDRKRLFVAGDSSGGCLAAAVALKDRDDGTRAIRGQVLLQPNTVHHDLLPDDKKHLFTSFDRVGKDGACVNSDTLTTMWTASRPDGEPGKYMCPYLHPDGHKDLPKAFVFFNSEDCLRDDGANYAQLLADSGVDVKTKEYVGYPHVWFTFPPLAKTREFFDDFVGAIRHVLE